MKIRKVVSRVLDGNGRAARMRDIEIGEAWEMESGEVWITLEALPFNGRLFILPPKEDSAQSSAGPPSY